MITITLNKIRAHSPCEYGWKTLLQSKTGVGMDDEFPLADVLDSNGLDDALWCLRCLPEHDKTWRLFAVWCARRVQHLITDQRSINALDVAERHAHGLATDEELAAARGAAGAARDAAGYAAWDAGAAARGAAWDAAWGAAWAAALGAALAGAGAAAGAARVAAGDALDVAERHAHGLATDKELAAAKAAQEEKLREMINDHDHA